MSVIVGRALPDARDGLKPVHRRILYAMHDLGLAPAKSFKKCARVVGEVLGKYHPHGDAAVYDSLVRLAQDFSMQLPLVSGQGNFGSLDDDPPAAMRYTECRLAQAASDVLLSDLDQDTVDWALTFDASQQEPLVLPARVPHLLVNGTQGIAVGIATKIPPHNLGEVVAGLEALVARPKISIPELMQFIPAPDFPTGGEVLLGPGIAEAYETGNGHVVLRARVTVEGGETVARRRRNADSARSGTADDAAQASSNGSSAAAGGAAGGKQLLVISEVPYQVNKAELVAKIAEQVENRTLDGIADVRDESDRDGVRLVVEVKRGYEAQVVLNQLFKHTRLQLRFACNMVALVGGKPQTLTLKDFLQHFLDFRVQVVERRARFQLGRAQERLHLVDGYLAAMQQLDAVVQAIRSAADTSAARAALVSACGLTAAQAEGVLSLTLRRLTALEAGKLSEEKAQLTATVKDLEQLLADRSRVLSEVIAEAKAAAAKHSAPRRSTLLQGVVSEPDESSLVPNLPGLVVMSSRGFMKRMRSEAFAAQRRGGKGKSGGRLRDDDAVEEVVGCMAHDSLLMLAASGKAYSIKAYRVPEASRMASGTAIVQVLGLSAPEAISAVLPVTSFSDDRQLVMATSRGNIKRTPLASFASINRAGTSAIKLVEGDSLRAAALVSAGGSVLLANSAGRVVHFPCTKETLRSTGKVAGAMKGMKLRPGEQLVSMVVLSPELAQQASGDGEADPHQEAAPAGGGESSRHQGGAVGDAAGDAAQSRKLERQQQRGASSSHPGGGEDGGQGLDGEEEPEEGQGPWLLFVTSKGLAARMPVGLFSIKGRGGQGVIGLRPREGDELTAMRLVGPTDEVVLMTSQGMVTRCAVGAVRVSRRGARGVKLMDVGAGDSVQTVALAPSGSGVDD